jgi:hypothetical protein
LATAASLKLWAEEMGRDWLGLSSVPLNSSSSQCRLRVLFASGGAVGEEDWTGVEGGAVQCGRISSVFETGSVWVPVERVAGLLRFRHHAHR